VIELQILNLAHNKSEIERRVHTIIDKFAERGLRSLAVAYQVCTDTYKHTGLFSERKENIKGNN
jgi:H+-transporting ATPase